MSSGKIIGEGNEQYYQIDVEENFECKMGLVRGKCDIFNEYKKIFDTDKEDVKYKISQIMPILKLKINKYDEFKKIKKSCGLQHTVKVSYFWGGENFFPKNKKVSKCHIFQ